MQRFECLPIPQCLQQVAKPSLAKRPQAFVAHRGIAPKIELELNLFAYVQKQRWLTKSGARSKGRREASPESARREEHNEESILSRMSSRTFMLHTVSGQTSYCSLSCTSNLYRSLFKQGYPLRNNFGDLPEHVHSSLRLIPPNSMNHCPNMYLKNRLTIVTSCHI